MMTDDVIDAVLTRIIVDNKAEDRDRINAIKEYNALRQRIIKKLDLSTMGEKLNVTGSMLELAQKYEDELKRKLQDDNAPRPDLDPQLGTK